MPEILSKCHKERKKKNFARNKHFQYSTVKVLKMLNIVYWQMEIDPSNNHKKYANITES